MAEDPLVETSHDQLLDVFHHLRSLCLRQTWKQGRNERFYRYYTCEHAVILLCRSDVSETNTINKNTLILLQLGPVSMENVISGRQLAELTIEVNRYILEEILHQVRLLLYRQILKQKT